MIKILKRPERFTPAGNDIIWQLQSTNPNFVHFQMTVVDDATDATIFTSTLKGMPDAPNGAAADLSSVLSNVIRYEVNNDSLKLVVPMQKTVRGYRLKLVEKSVDTDTGALMDGDTYDKLEDVNYVFNAKLGRVDANNVRNSKYVISSGTTASFLTTKPNYTKMNDISAEHLYLLQDGTASGLHARVRTFDGSGSLIQSELEVLPQPEKYKSYRLNVSPKALQASSNISFDGVAYYVVDVVDGSLTAKTEERVYLYEEVQCWLEYVNLLWVNSLGGIDSYSFIQPQDTINTNRFLIKKNTKSLNSDGVYSDLNAGVYNPSDVILNNTVTTVTRVNSKELTDGEALWLQELFMSKQLFVELQDGTLVPALLNNTSYTIPKLRYVRGTPNTIQIDFTLAEGVIPSGAQAYSRRVGSLDFIDSQMNVLVANLPGYNVSSNDSGPNVYSDTDYNHNYK